VNSSPHNNGEHSERRTPEPSAGTAAKPGELLLGSNRYHLGTSKLTGVVENTYTTDSRAVTGANMAFLRRKGNTFYLVHNVRERGRVKQLHLAKLGERPRITDDVVRQVSRAYPFLDVNWNQLREQINDRVELFDPKSMYVQKLVSSLRNLNLDLADLFPPLLDVSQAPEASQEILTQLRLLHSTVGIKLDQFDRAPHRGIFRRPEVPVGR
jgi:hypothetical protein